MYCNMVNLIKVLCAGRTLVGRKADSHGNADSMESMKSNRASWRGGNSDFGHSFLDAGDRLYLLWPVAGIFNERRSPAGGGGGNTVAVIVLVFSGKGSGDCGYSGVAERRGGTDADGDVVTDGR